MVCVSSSISLSYLELRIKQQKCRDLSESIDIGRFENRTSKKTSSTYLTSIADVATHPIEESGLTWLMTLTKNFKSQ